MKQIRLMLYVFHFFCFSLNGLQAQEAVSAAGGNAYGENGSISYSVAQEFYSGYLGSTVSVVEGVQQPYEVSVVTGIADAVWINLSVLAFPNPTSDLLKLRIEASASHEIQKLSYQLYDLSGRILENKKITGIETCIDMNKYVPAAYLLKVTGNMKEIKCFNIIKN